MIVVLFIISNRIYYYVDNKLHVKIYHKDVKNGIANELIINILLDNIIINKKKTIIKLVCNSKDTLLINYQYQHFYIGDLLNSDDCYININNDYINKYYLNTLTVYNIDYDIQSLIEKNTNNILFGEHKKISQIYQNINKIKKVYFKRNYLIELIKNLLHDE